MRTSLLRLPHARRKRFSTYREHKPFDHHAQLRILGLTFIAGYSPWRWGFSIYHTNGAGFVWTARRLGIRFGMDGKR